MWSIFCHVLAIPVSPWVGGVSLQVFAHFLLDCCLWLEFGEFHFLTVSFSEQTFFKIIYLFIFGCVVSSLLHVGFL